MQGLIKRIFIILILCYGFQNIYAQIGDLIDIFDTPKLLTRSTLDPAPGYYFLEKNGLLNSYIMIVNNSGIPYFVRKINGNAHNFQRQSNGYLTYYYTQDKSFVVLDSSYNIHDKYFMQNGVEADSHEFLMLENGHVFMMGYYPQPMDMSEIVEGGDTAANVIELVIQEFDENKNLVFDWHSLDYINVTDTEDETILTNHTIDYIHGNSIFVDTDTSIIISSRATSEVTRISRISGEIIWRLGGIRNEFTFTNPKDIFHKQHSALLLENGNLILYDNGDPSDIYSRGVEYKFNQQLKTISAIREFRYNPDVYSPAMGNIQRLPNGNTLVCWGKNKSENIFAEFDADGNIVNDFYSDDNTKSYRTTKYPWKTNLLSFEKDTFTFRYRYPMEKLTRNFKLYNNSEQVLKITRVAMEKNNYVSVKSVLPLNIPPGESENISFEFNVNQFTEDDTFSVMLQSERYKYSDFNDIVSAVFTVLYKYDPNADVTLTKDNTSIKIWYDIKNTTICIENFEDQVNYVRIFDVLGIVVYEKKHNIGNLYFQTAQFQSNVFFVSIKGKHYHVIKKIVVQD